MKNFRSILFAALFLFAATGFANPDDSTPISGNYNGTVETKTFIKSDKDLKAASAKDFGVEFLFNGNVFIYQGLSSKAMGTYKVVGDHIHFTVTSVKGDAQKVNAIFAKEYKYSKAGGQLMLISEASENADVHIVRLTKQKQ